MMKYSVPSRYRGSSFAPSLHRGFFVIRPAEVSLYRGFLYGNFFLFPIFKLFL